MSFLLEPNLFGNFAILAGFVALALVVTVAARAVLHARWNRERERVRAVILQNVGVPLEQAGQRVLAIVPCRAVVRDGPLQSLPHRRRLWLCFLPEHLVIAPGEEADPTVTPMAWVSRIYLVEKGRWRGHLLAIQVAAATSIFALDRLDDLVRVVNVLVKQGIALRYHRNADRPFG
jgi:hypothetical protein